MDPIVHFELPVDNMERARAFYSSIFDWKLTDWTMPDGSIYVGVHTTPINEKTREPLKPGAINGAIVKRDDKTPAPVFAVHVSSIDERMDMILKSGGSVVSPKVSIMGMGFYAYAKDCEGNVIGLWEDAPKQD